MAINLHSNSSFHPAGTRRAPNTALSQRRRAGLVHRTRGRAAPRWRLPRSPPRLGRGADGDRPPRSAAPPAQNGPGAARGCVQPCRTNGCTTSRRTARTADPEIVAGEPRSWKMPRSGFLLAKISATLETNSSSRRGCWVPWECCCTARRQRQHRARGVHRLCQHPAGPRSQRRAPSSPTFLSISQCREAVLTFTHCQ